MKNTIILHIPHSSLKLPKNFKNQIIVEKAIVDEFLREICDTDTLILYGENQYIKIFPKYSRIYCDVERFSNDDLEPMSKFGQGMIYEKTNKGITFRKCTQQQRDKIYKKYYKPYHNKLNRIVNKYLQLKQNVLLIDCHSFSRDIILFEDKKENLPDICLGWNNELPEILLSVVTRYFQNNGY